MGLLRASGRPFYGWTVVGAVFLVLCTTAGLGFYNASVILSAAAIELDASVSSVSGATGIFFAVAGLSGFVLSKWMDEVDIRLFFFSGGLVGASALYGLRWVDSVPKLYIFFSLFGIGFGLAGLVPGTTLVTRWFDRRRSVALSIASTGLSLGGIIITPVAARLIEGRGLADAGTLLAVAWLIGVIPLSMLLLRSYPASLGLLPDGRHDQPTSTVEAGEAELVEPVGVSFAAARRTRFFVAVCAAYAFIFFGQVGALAQMYNMARERTDAATAASCLSAVALASVAARLIGGLVVLRVPTKLFTALLAVVQAVALVLLGQSMTATSLIASSVLLGVSIGNLLMLQPLLLAETFGVVNYSRIYSFSQLIGTVGVAGGPYGLGVLRDNFDYRVALMVAGASSFAGFLALVAAGPIESVRRLWA